MGVYEIPKAGQTLAWRATERWPVSVGYIVSKMESVASEGGLGPGLGSLTVPERDLCFLICI